MLINLFTGSTLDAQIVFILRVLTATLILLALKEAHLLRDLFNYIIERRSHCRIWYPARPYQISNRCTARGHILLRNFGLFLVLAFDFVFLSFAYLRSTILLQNIPLTRYYISIERQMLVQELPHDEPETVYIHWDDGLLDLLWLLQNFRGWPDWDVSVAVEHIGVLFKLCSFKAIDLYP